MDRARHEEGLRGQELLAKRYELAMQDQDCAECSCSSSAVAMAGGCPKRLQNALSSNDPDRRDDGEAEHHDALEGAEWAFFWAAVTIGLIALLALAGYVWKRWLHAMAAGWLS